MIERIAIFKYKTQDGHTKRIWFTIPLRTTLRECIYMKAEEWKNKIYKETRGDCRKESIEFVGTRKEEV